MKNRRHPAFSRVMDAVAAYSPRTQGNDPAALASTLSAVHRRFPVPPGGTSARLLIPRLRSLAGAPLPLSSPPIRIWLKPLHLAIGCRQSVRRVLVLERQPRRPEVLLGLVDAAGAAEWRAGNVDLHVPDQTSGVRSLA